MNDENIKEILFDMDLIVNHNKVPIYFTQNKVKLLLDYITNLQQAIKDTKDTADDMLYELKQENERLKEKNKQLKENNKDAIMYIIGHRPYEDREYLINILQNGVTVNE